MSVYKTVLLKIILGKLSFESNYTVNRILIYFLYGVLIYYISIFIHELGHYTMSRLMGIRVKLFVIGPIKYINDEKKN